MRSKFLVVLLLLTGLSCLGGFTNNATADESATQPAVIPSDSALAANVLRQIQSNSLYGVFDWVTVAADDGAVTLNGWVDEPWHKRQFEHRAKNVAGVARVTNNIKVESFTNADNDIRHKAANLIYNDPFFQPYSKLPGPPIHIIVDHRYVTLEGSVSTQLQADRATQDIYAVTNAYTVDNHLKVEEQ